MNDTARERDRRYLWHVWSPLSADMARLVLSRGEGYRVWDADGTEYLDASSLNATCGYAHPHIAAAVERQLLRLPGYDLSVATHETAGLLAERLASLLPGTLSRTLFVNSGTEGCEAAVMMAAGYAAHIGDPRSRIVSFTRGYHGSTLASRALSGLPHLAHPLGAPLRTTYVDLPLPAREMRRPEALPLLVERFEAAFGTDPSDRPLAVVVEPLLNVGGGVVLPPGFLRALRELCDAHGVLLVLDEVSTGFGRTGRMFAFERDGVAPDILVTSKGLASGYVPIAAVTAEERIYRSFDRDPVMGGLRFGQTTSGHAAACAAALATLDVIEREGLVKRADDVGAELLARFGRLTGTNGVVDVRGLGLLVSLEIASADAAADLVTRAELGGLLLRRQGEVVMTVPPLTIDDAGVEEMARRVEDAVAGGAG